MATMKARIVATKQIAHSINGNPRFIIEVLPLDHGKVGTRMYPTAPDHSFNYEIGNRGMRPGYDVEITVNADGQISDMVPVK